jgi:uncharacterized protein
MGQAVVHFEVIGKDGPKMREFYGELFDWKFSDPMGPTNYAVTPPDGNRAENSNADGVGIGGGVGTGPEGYDGHVTFYVEVDDVEAALAKAESLGGTRMMGPEEMGDVGITIGLFTDPEGHVIGVVK